MSGHLFVTSDKGIDVLRGKSGVRGSALDSPYGFKPTSVAAYGGVFAVAWAAEDKHLRGKISIYDAESLNELASFQAGYLPDMVTFTPHGNILLAANEGEPTEDYSFDPEASLTLIDISGGITTAEAFEVSFEEFNSQYDALCDRGIRLFGSNRPDKRVTVAQDLEPEYIAVSSDSTRAWITLQENNAIGEFDLQQKKIVALHPLGKKNFYRLTNPTSLGESTGLDASDKDGGAMIRHWPVLGLYQPDGIAAFDHAGKSYLITANEGDPRDYLNFSESLSIDEMERQGIAFDRRLRARFLGAPHQLGRLQVSAISGDNDRDGDLDELHCFGTRSISIWSTDDSGALELLYDSGSEFETITASEAPDRYNADSSSDSLADVRSSIRGPEPESVVVGQVGSHRLAAVGLERTGGVMIYDITEPTKAHFLKYIPPVLANGVLDCAPEGLLFIPKEKSPVKKPMLVVCNEASATTTAYVLEWSKNKFAKAN